MKNKYIILTVKFFSMLLLFGVQKLLTSYLDVSQYGEFNFVLSLINFCSTIVILGGDRLIINQFSFRNYKFKAEIISNTSQVAIILTIIIGLLFSFFNLNEYKLYFIAGLMLNSLLIILSSIYKGNNQVIFGDIILRIIRPLIFIILLLVLVPNQVDNVLNLYIISLFPFMLFLFYKYPLIKVKFNNREKYIKQGLTMSFFSLAIIALPSLEIYIFGLLNKNYENGIFSLSIKIATIIPIFLVTINSLLAPSIGKYFKFNNQDLLQSSIRKNNKIAFPFSILLCIIIIFLSDHILSFFGAEFLKFKLVLILLCIIQLINVLFGPTILVASYCPSRLEIAKKLLISSLVISVFSYFLIKIYGLYGGVVSHLISVLIVNFLIHVHMKNYYKLKLSSI